MNLLQEGMAVFDISTAARLLATRNMEAGMNNF